MVHTVPDPVLRRPSRPFNPYANWRNYRNGQIVFNSAEDIERWEAHPDGILVEMGDFLYVNKAKVFHEKEMRLSMWYGHHKGFIFRKGNEFYQKGREWIYGGLGEKGGGHPAGVIVQQGRKLLLNGSHVLYEGDWQEWDGHPEGFIVQIDGHILLNATTLLYEGDFDTWLTHPRGAVIQKGGGLFS